MKVANHPATWGATGGYMLGKSGRNSLLAATGSLPAKYGQLQRAHNQLAQDHVQLSQQVGKLLRRRADGQRLTALRRLADRYPAFVDLDEECRVSLYSRGSQLGQRAFAAHLATVEKYARLSGRGTGSRQPQNASQDKYAAKLSRVAVQIHTTAVNAGKPGLTWDEAKAAAQKQLASRARR